MSNKQEFFWDFEELPFVWSELSNPENGSDIPNTLPFQLFVDESNGVLTQKSSNLIEESLEKAYENGSVIAGVMDDDSEGSAYADDFIAFFLESTCEKDISNLKVLEIGSGTGYLLSCIQKLGANVIGIEPGIHCLNAKEKYNVDVIHDFFPSDKIKEKYDVVVMSVILEHFKEPSDFLKLLHPYIKENGLLIISVPDEEPFIKAGDISTLFHEHYSYFTQDTLDSTLKVGGFRATEKKIGKYGGLLFRAAVTDIGCRVDPNEIVKGYDLAISYKRRAIAYIEKLKTYLEGIKQEGKTLGVYVPSRFINFLSVAKIDLKDIRFFDDNPSIKGKYYPGFNIPIETKKDLLSLPTDIVLIFSNAFGERIAESLSGKLPEDTQVITWKELFLDACIDE